MPSREPQLVPAEAAAKLAVQGSVFRNNSISRIASSQDFWSPLEQTGTTLELPSHWPPSDWPFSNN
jgi:hypothetical protein